MDTAKAKQNEIIDLIVSITDIRQLSAIYAEVKSRLPSKVEKNDEQLPWQHALAHIRERTTFADLVAEQGEKSLSYETMSELSAGIEWPCSLEELLDMLD